MALCFLSSDALKSLFDCIETTYSDDEKLAPAVGRMDEGSMLEFAVASSREMDLRALLSIERDRDTRELFGWSSRKFMISIDFVLCVGDRSDDFFVLVFVVVDECFEC